MSPRREAERPPARAERPDDENGWKRERPVAPAEHTPVEADTGWPRNRRRPPGDISHAS